MDYYRSDELARLKHRNAVLEQQLSQMQDIIGLFSGSAIAIKRIAAMLDGHAEDMFTAHTGVRSDGRDVA